jgi:hypothetical protein
MKHFRLARIMMGSGEWGVGNREWGVLIYLSFQSHSPLPTPYSHS